MSNNNNNSRIGQKGSLPKNPSIAASKKTDGSGSQKLTPESKREEFRRYLEKAGVMDALTKVLVGLYEEPEKPANAIEYFLERLNTGAPLKFELDSIQSEMSDLQRKLGELEQENDRLRRRVEQYENSNNEEAEDRH